MKLNTFLTFEPIFQYRIWGGNKLKTVLNKNYEEDNIGESWEISDVKGFESPITIPMADCKNLRDLINSYPLEILGKHVLDKYGKEFPLLIKFIDSDQPLSLQVYPNDDFAKKHHNSFGKTEMWYVMAADENAEIISGFTKPLDLIQYREALKKNEIEDIVKKWKVKKGDTIFLPAGRIHAIGAGILVAEIQQTSDVTYRIYDYNRIDKDGKTRDLHNDIAEKVIKFDDINSPFVQVSKSHNQVNNLVECPYFKTNLLQFSNPITRDYETLNSFVILIGVEGEALLTSKLENIKIKYGETILIPASKLSEVNFKPNIETKILEVYIPY